MRRSGAYFILISGLCLVASADPQDRAAVEAVLSVNQTVQKALDPTCARCAIPDPPPALASTGDSLMDRCLKNPKVAEDKWVKVSYFSTALCKKTPWWQGDKVYGTPVRYKLRKKNGKLEVAVSIYFEYQGYEGARDLVLKRLESSKSCIQNFYRRFGIALNLDFKVDSGWSDWWNSDHAVDLYDNFERANSSNWAMLVTCGHSLYEDQACGTAAHELGHLLGLEDEYVDPDCPDRETLGPSDSIMNAGGWDGPDAVRLYPNNLAKIIKPLCDP